MSNENDKTPGPDPEFLKIDMDFDEAGMKLVNKPKPTDGWPDPILKGDKVKHRETGEEGKVIDTDGDTVQVDKGSAGNALWAITDISKVK